MVRSAAMLAVVKSRVHVFHHAVVLTHLGLSAVQNEFAVRASHQGGVAREQQWRRANLSAHRHIVKVFVVMYHLVLSANVIFHVHLAYKLTAIGAFESPSTIRVNVA